MEFTCAGWPFRVEAYVGIHNGNDIRVCLTSARESCADPGIVDSEAMAALRTWPLYADVHPPLLRGLTNHDARVI
jgi:hypothetical protein